MYKMQAFKYFLLSVKGFLQPGSQSLPYFGFNLTFQFFSSNNNDVSIYRVPAIYKCLTQ